MDLFKFIPDTSPTDIEQGQRINNMDSVMWVERYREPGEFEIKGKLSSGLKTFLPLGTLIAQVSSDEIMIVENQEIEEDVDIDPMITITGRTFDSYLENRFVGTTLARVSSTISEYILSAGAAWDQAVILINDHIHSGASPDDEIVNALGYTGIADTPLYSVDRTINRNNVLQELLSLLAVEDLGIRTNRNYGPIGLNIYRGVDKSSEIIFSWKSGHLNSANFLLTLKNLKNSALVVGRYVFTMVDGGPTGYDRRIMMVSADDIDGNLSAAPTGGALTSIINKMIIRGQQALSKQNNVTITQTDISKNSSFQFRRDYGIGDLVTLDGNFGQNIVMRVTEYAEIEDANGVSGHPTLSLPGV